MDGKTARQAEGSAGGLAEDALEAKQVDAFAVLLISASVGFLKVELPAKPALAKATQQKGGRPVAVVVVACGEDQALDVRGVGHAVAVVIDAAGEPLAVRPELPLPVAAAPGGAGDQPAMHVLAQAKCPPSVCNRFEDDVDDPTHGLAPKPSTSRALDDFHLLHHGQGQPVQRIGRGQAAEKWHPIQEHEGVDAFQAVDVNVLRATDAATDGFADAVGEVKGFNGIIGDSGLQGSAADDLRANGAHFPDRGGGQATDDRGATEHHNILGKGEGRRLAAGQSDRVRHVADGRSPHHAGRALPPPNPVAIRHAKRLAAGRPLKVSAGNGQAVGGGEAEGGLA